MQRKKSSTSEQAAEISYDELLELVASRIESGDSSGVERLLDDHPNHAARARKILPAMNAMFELGLTTEAGQSGINAAAEPGAAESIDGLLGDYRIIREIGRGGMGIVYEAEQLSLNRHVALKVLPLASTLDEKHLQRFRNEAYAAASLSHPHIVDAYAVGVERGVHYFAMKYIEGQDLSAILAQLRPESPTATGRQTATPAMRSSDIASSSTELADLAPQPSATAGDTLRANAENVSTQLEILSLSQSDWKHFVCSIVSLFVDAAEALDYAHQQGVVHRDIKPSNLMLDQTGRIWIADFGLAQMERAAEMTMTGDIVGTLRYMSPEQASGERQIQDHRTDVYSLGITLYEALASRPAFPETDRMRLLQQVREGDPPPLRSLAPKIPRNLEVIVHKAIAKEPSQRYPSAQAFADDLRRFQEGATIRAKPPTYFQRIASWGRKHPVSVASTYVFLVLVALFSLLTAVLLFQERGKTLAALSEADVAKQQAESKASEASAVLSFMLNDLLAAADPEQTRGADIRVDTLLKNASRAVEPAFKDQPLVKASVRFMLGRVYRRIGDREAAYDQLAAAYDTRKRLLGVDHLETLGLAYELADVQFLRGQYDAAEALHESVYQQRKRLLGESHVATQLSYLSLARSAKSRGDYARAEQMTRQVMQTDYGETADGPKLKLDAKQTLAQILRNQDRYDEAAKALRDILAQQQRREGTFDSQILVVKRDLASVLYEQAKHEEAEGLLRDVLAEFTEIYGDAHPATLAMLRQLGDVQRMLDDLPAARTTLESVYKIQKKTLGGDNFSVATAANSLAIVLQDLELWDESLKYFREAERVMVKIEGPDHPNTLSVKHNIARSLTGLGELEQAAAIHRDVLTVRQRVLGPNHSQTAKSLSCLSGICCELDDHAAAKELLQQVLQAREAIFGPTSPPTMETKWFLVVECVHLQQFADAKRRFESMKRDMDASLGADDPETISMMVSYGQLMSDAGDQVEASLTFLDVVEMRERTLGPDHPDTINAKKDLQIILGRLSPDFGHLLDQIFELTSSERVESFGRDLLTSGWPWVRLAW